MKKISVIIPVYKVEDYLDQCVRSVINQTYKNLEIWLVDDGSPDKCPDICDMYAELDSRIHVIHQKNKGQGAARNAALKQCTGDWIAFVDSDDWIEPETYTSMLEFANEAKLDIVFCTAKIIRGTDCRERGFEYFPDRTIKTAREIEKLTLIDAIGGQPWLKIYRRECWDDLRFPEAMKYEDLAISWLPFAASNGKVGFLKQPFYNYRMNEQGTSLSHSWSKSADIFWGMYQHYVYAQKHYSEVEDICFCNAIRFALGTYNCHIRSGRKTDQEKLQMAMEFLSEHRKNVWKQKGIQRQQKLRFILYYYCRPLYNALLSIAKK